MEKKQSEILAAVRFQSSSLEAYRFKKLRVKTAYDLIKSFKSNNGEINDNIRENAQLYHDAIYEINYYGKINPSSVTNERVLNCVNGIINASSQTLLKYHFSFKRKESEEYRNNAWEDLMFAYKVYCLANGITINENISESEMQLLVTEIESKTNKEKNSGQLK